MANYDSYQVKKSERLALIIALIGIKKVIQIMSIPRNNSQIIFERQLFIFYVNITKKEIYSTLFSLDFFTVEYRKQEKGHFKKYI